MPLLDKLLLSRKKKSLRDSVESLVSGAQTAENDRNTALRLETDQVRILLFRECEWRGKKLLFDSVTFRKHRNKGETVCATVNNKVQGKCETSLNIGVAADFERGKMPEDDINLLSEMVFGTVAMTYRGSSFKVHSINSPSCIMCTKIFPATEHSMCKSSSEKSSDEGLGRSIQIDSTSINTSMRSLFSRPSSGNLSGNDLHLGRPRKTSTCSSIGSGWDVDIVPPTGSSQSLESNGSSSLGSLSSLRRRWLRAISTSLIRSDSDDVFGIQHWGENSGDGHDEHMKRHKTRLGLTMLIRLSPDHDSKVETRLLEHMALLEGMLDRLRYFCIETSNINVRSCKGMQLDDRICRATSRFVISLLHILLNVNTDKSSCTPLLWHDVLLNSVIMKQNITDTLHRNLQQMCQLFDELDTKSTNFFLSTVVTAALTYHLGWIYTVLSPCERQMIEKLGSWYSYNPLWAQLGDLHGALGNPVKVAHTVIVGESWKIDLINSVLSFLSYFIRSGLVRKQQEYRCSPQQDVQEATNLLEQARNKRPYLFTKRRSTCTLNDRDITDFRRESRVLSSRKSIQSSLDTGSRNANTESHHASRYPLERPRITRSASPLKCSDITKSGLDNLMTKSTDASMDFKFLSKEFSHEYEKNEKYTPVQDEQSIKNIVKNTSSGKVKIIVSEVGLQEETTGKEYQQNCSSYSLRSFEKKLNAYDAAASLVTEKSEHYQQLDNNVDPFKVYFNRSELSFDTDRRFLDEGKESQVFFTLGGEDKSTKLSSRPTNSCQCSYTFTRVPSTSAQLPEGVLRKIIQRNFPESSKSIQPPPDATSSMDARSIGFCLKCNGQGYLSSRNYEGSKQVLETPTNATEVLRTCGSSVSDRTVGITRSNSLEALMEANGVVELPMPRSRKISTSKSGSIEETGFTKTLLQNKMMNNEINVLDTSYTWGLVLQGMIKKKKRRKKNKILESKEDNNEIEPEEEEKWWSCVWDDVVASTRFPTIDQPVAEALCILADLDTWHVKILSNSTSCQNPTLPVGMSRLVSNMLESFAYVWRKYHSPTHCIAILEAKLRELWLKSETLAEMMMAMEECDANVNNLTSALDLDAADIPLLLAVATVHSPEITQRFGLTLT